MGQHYIPQYYLDGFSDSPTSSNIWVYEKDSNRIFRTTTKTVANENRRWPKSVEAYLANQVEAPAKSVLEKIRNRKPIMQGDKDVLSAYMVVMLKRVPRGLERTKTNAPDVLEQTFASLNIDILRLISEHPSKASILQNRLQELQSLKLKYQSEFPMEVWYDNLTPDSSPRLLAILPAMTWIFLSSDKRQPFLTNDNPVFFFESLGIGRPESEISFPISSTIALGHKPASSNICRRIKFKGWIPFRMCPSKIY